MELIGYVMAAPGIEATYPPLTSLLTFRRSLALKMSDFRVSVA